MLYVRDLNGFNKIIVNLQWKQCILKKKISNDISEKENDDVILIRKGHQSRK